MFYGHMFINPKDAPFAVAMAALLYALVRAIEEYPRPGAATIVIFGVSLGLDARHPHHGRHGGAVRDAAARAADRA